MVIIVISVFTEVSMSKTTKIILLTGLLAVNSGLMYANPVLDAKNSGLANGAYTITKNIGKGVYGAAKVLGSAAVGASQLIAKLDCLGEIAKKNPRITAVISLLTAAAAGRTAYSYYYAPDYTTLLDQAKKYTKYLDVSQQGQVGKPSDMICVWRNTPGMQDVAGTAAFFEAPFDIAFAKDSVWQLLKADRELMFPSIKGDDAAYKKAILTEIKKQKDTLYPIRKSILEKFWPNRLSLSGNPAVFDLINTELKILLENSPLSLINQKQIQKVTAEIESLYSLYWPSNIVAQIYDPLLQQRELAEQYWKLLICMARLEAIHQEVASATA